MKIIYMDISKDALRTLKLFYKKVSLPDEEISKLSADSFAALEKAEFVTRDFLGYLDGYHAKYTNYHITDAGKAHYQNRSKSEWLRQNWISLLSLLFALIAALPVIIQGIDSILKYIM